MAGCNTLEEVRGWARGRRVKGSVWTTLSVAPMARGMRKGWDWCDTAYQEGWSWRSSLNILLKVWFVVDFFWFFSVLLLLLNLRSSQSSLLVFNCAEKEEYSSRFRSLSPNSFPSVQKKAPSIIQKELLKIVYKTAFHRLCWRKEHSVYCCGARAGALQSSSWRWGIWMAPR